MTGSAQSFVNASPCFDEERKAYHSTDFAIQRTGELLEPNAKLCRLLTAGGGSIADRRRLQKCKRASVAAEDFQASFTRSTIRCNEGKYRSAVAHSAVP